MPELMKGKVWGERKDKVKYPVLVEPKVDEIRCHVILVDESPIPGYSVKFLSYAGKPLHNLHALELGLVEAMRWLGIPELDCGVEVNMNFNDSYRYVRSSRGIPEDLREAEVRLHLYDFPAGHGWGSLAAYKERKVSLEHTAEALRRKGLIAQVLPHEWAYGAEDVEAAFLHYMAAGYEGAMVKNPHYTYARGKRTDDWLKLKPEFDGDGEIIALHEAVCGKDQPALGIYEGDKLGRIGSITVRLEDGTEATPHGIPWALGKQMFNFPQEFLGQWCEFRYMERDRQGGYRHPTFNRLREAKR